MNLPTYLTRRSLISRFLVTGLCGFAALRPFKKAIASPSEDAFQASFPSMGSMIELRWIDETLNDASKILEKVQSAADAWVDVLSDYQQDSQCMQVCRTADSLEWVTPTPELWQMLKACDRWYRLSEGAFDASLGALTQLRRRKREASEQQWKDARDKCGWHHLEIDHENRRLRFNRPGLRFDFGAIGKGFVVDRLAEVLESLGLRCYAINASGNMRFGAGILDSAPTSSIGDEARNGWPVSIGALGHPDRELQRLRLVHGSIATSGDQYQRFRDGSLQEGRPASSHIVDPEAKRGLESPNMATVITDSATDADAMATACCVHMQRGSIRGWLHRVESAFDRLEILLQSQSEREIALTTINRSKD